jgi:hypothetical protein
MDQYEGPAVEFFSTLLPFRCFARRPPPPPPPAPVVEPVILKTLLY